MDNRLINLIHVVSRGAWPPEQSHVQLGAQTIDWSCRKWVTPTHDTRASVPFSYESLEVLWDPNLRRSRAASRTSAQPLPRATYELDCNKWIRAPLSSDGLHRGIMQLACLVADCSLHVFNDRERLLHTLKFSARVDAVLARTRASLRRQHKGCGSTKPCTHTLTMDDSQLVNDLAALAAVATAASSCLLIDSAAPSRAILVPCGGPTDSGKQHPTCAWFLRDPATETWAVHVFQEHALGDVLPVVQRAAFTYAIKMEEWETASHASLIAACERAAIEVPFLSTHASLVGHIRATLSEQ